MEWMLYWLNFSLQFCTPCETKLSKEEKYLREQVLIYNKSSFHSCGFVGQMFRGMQSIILMGGSINLAHTCLILPSLKPLRCIISLTSIPDFSVPCLQKASRLKSTVMWMKYKLQWNINSCKSLLMLMEIFKANPAPPPLLCCFVRYKDCASTVGF